MSFVTFRFYGRFVIAEKTDGTRMLTFLAPRFTPPLAAHKISMCVRRSNIFPRTTTLPPTVRFLSAEEAPELAEHLLWDLTGGNVGFDGAGGTTLDVDGPSELADLADLEDLQGRRGASLRLSNLTAHRRGPVNAAIELKSGDGVARQILEEFSDFVPLDVKRPSKLRRVQVADIIEVRVKLAASQSRLNLDVSTDSSTSTVVVRTTDKRGQESAGRQASAVVTFSHLCPKVPSFEQFDAEFGQYYELLKNPSSRAATRRKGGARPDRLIPKTLPSGGEGGDCNKPARVAYSGSGG